MELEENRKNTLRATEEDIEEERMYKEFIQKGGEKFNEEEYWNEVEESVEMKPKKLTSKDNNKSQNTEKKHLLPTKPTPPNPHNRNRSLLNQHQWQKLN
jgi:hypothetical protein